MFRLMHEELEVFIPLGIQVIVNDLAPRHMAVPDSQSAHVQAKLYSTNMHAALHGQVHVGTPQDAALRGTHSAHAKP